MLIQNYSTFCVHCTNMLIIIFSFWKELSICNSEVFYCIYWIIFISSRKLTHVYRLLISVQLYFCLFWVEKAVNQKFIFKVTRLGFPRNSQFSCATVSWFFTRNDFLHANNFRINTKPVLHKIAHSFEINNFFCTKFHMHTKLKLEFFYDIAHEYSLVLHVIVQCPWIRKIKMFVLQFVSVKKQFPSNPACLQVQTGVELIVIMINYLVNK